MEMCAKRPSLKRTAKLQKLLCFGGVVLACFALSLPGMLNIVEAMLPDLLNLTTETLAACTTCLQALTLWHATR